MTWKWNQVGQITIPIQHDSDCTKRTGACYRLVTAGRKCCLLKYSSAKIASLMFKLLICLLIGLAEAANERD